MENETIKGEASKAPSLPEQSSGHSPLASEQWIILALNNLQQEIRELKTDLKDLGKRVRSLEGWIKWVGGVISTVTFLILLVLFLSRLGVDISITMKPEPTRPASPPEVPIRQN